MKYSRKKYVFKRKEWIYIFICLLGFYLILPQLKVFHSSIQTLTHLDSRYIVLAIVSTLLTYIFAALTFVILATKRLQYLKTLIVQFASMFANRLLPAGIGNISVNYLYLTKSGISGPRAASTIAANNIIGFLGHLIYLILAIILTRNLFSHLNILGRTHIISYSDWIWAALVVVLCIICLKLIRIKSRIKNNFNKAIRDLYQYSKQPQKVIFGLISSVCLTSANIFCLFYCCLALHLDISFISVFIVFTVGIALGTFTPTPGGLGGVEAGLFASLVAIHISSSNALAVVLLFRIISFWFTFILGAIALVYAERVELL